VFEDVYATLRGLQEAFAAGDPSPDSPEFQERRLEHGQAVRAARRDAPRPRTPGVTGVTPHGLSGFPSPYSQSFQIGPKSLSGAFFSTYAVKSSVSAFRWRRVAAQPWMMS